MSEERVELVETHVARLGNARVGVGNVLPGTYTDEKGATHQGLVLILHPAPAAGQVEQSLTVGEGSVFKLGGAAWTVVSINTGARPGATVVRRP